MEAKIILMTVSQSKHKSLEIMKLLRAQHNWHLMHNFFSAAERYLNVSGSVSAPLGHCSR